MHQGIHCANAVFHVKPILSTAAALGLACALCGCQATPVEEETEPHINVGALEQIALIVTSEVSALAEQGDPSETVPLPTAEEAQEATGIMTDEEGMSYATGEILVTLKGSSNIADINQQLSLCDFIEENRIGNEMMVVGEIRNGEIKKGSMGEAVVLLHTAEGVHVNQAIAILKEVGVLKDASPNYLLTVQDDAEEGLSASTDSEDAGSSEEPESE